jgi:hypothetical protein
VLISLVNVALRFKQKYFMPSVCAVCGTESTQFLLFRCRKGDDELLLCPTCTHASLQAHTGEVKH